MTDQQKLEQLVDVFAGEMKRRLISKMEEGYQGWDAGGDVVTKKILRSMLLGNVMEEHWIDVANLAAFLWYRTPPKGLTAKTDR